jgi:hypothetical protein
MIWRFQAHFSLLSLCQTHQHQEYLSLLEWLHLFLQIFSCQSNSFQDCVTVEVVCSKMSLLLSANVLHCLFGGQPDTRELCGTDVHHLGEALVGPLHLVVLPGKYIPLVRGIPLTNHSFLLSEKYHKQILF